jgi:putative hemolysin
MNRMKIVGIGVIFLLLVLYCGCTTTDVPPASLPSSQQAMGNPASLYCRSLGYESVIKKDATGAEYGVCCLPNGTEVDEWELYRSAHQNLTT